MLQQLQPGLPLLTSWAPLQASVARPKMESSRSPGDSGKGTTLSHGVQPLPVALRAALAAFLLRRVGSCRVPGTRDWVRHQGCWAWPQLVASPVASPVASSVASLVAALGLLIEASDSWQTAQAMLLQQAAAGALEARVVLAAAAELVASVVHAVGEAPHTAAWTVGQTVGQTSPMESLQVLVLVLVLEQLALVQVLGQPACTAAVAALKRHLRHRRLAVVE